jgi:hypothetical protein
VIEYSLSTAVRPLIGWSCFVRPFTRPVSGTSRGMSYAGRTRAGLCERKCPFALSVESPGTGASYDTLSLAS